jgi:hypothetical protein
MIQGQNLPAGSVQGHQVVAEAVRRLLRPPGTPFSSVRQVPRLRRISHRSAGATAEQVAKLGLIFHFGISSALSSLFRGLKNLFFFPVNKVNQVLAP